MTTDEKYIKRCLELAQLGAGKVTPNPLVGSVVVHRHKIIGEGWHQAYGGPHAEVNAIRGVQDKSLLLNATIYVSLEPCFHYGQTPPCVDLILKHQIPKVVIATTDPNPKVAGKSVEKLKKAGVQVSVGILENEALELNKFFFTSIIHKRPYVVLKWAESHDGYFAPHSGQQWLSNDFTKRLTHKWRNEMDAILVGKNTLIHDQPALTDRFWDGHQPIKILIDPDGNNYQSTAPLQTIIFNAHQTEVKANIEWIKISKYPFEINELLTQLYQRKITSLLVEGGAFTLQHFIDSNLWDEAYIYQSTVNLNDGILAPSLNSKFQVNSLSVSDNQLKIFKNK